MDKHGFPFDEWYKVRYWRILKLKKKDERSLKIKFNKNMNNKNQLLTSK
jgi:ABC-type oligopeptide transport system substrate-binding subunit